MANLVGPCGCLNNKPGDVSRISHYQQLYCKQNFATRFQSALSLHMKAIFSSFFPVAAVIPVAKYLPLGALSKVDALRLRNATTEV